jgi:hypothetical protein
MVFAGSSYDKRALLAIRLDDAAGDITGSDRVAWTRNRGTPYVPSPLLYQDALFFQLRDRFNASAAIVGRELLLRGEKYLYFISQEESP